MSICCDVQHSELIASTADANDITNSKQEDSCERRIEERRVTLDRSTTQHTTHISSATKTTKSHVRDGRSPAIITSSEYGSCNLCTMSVPCVLFSPYTIVPYTAYVDPHVVVLLVSASTDFQRELHHDEMSIRMSSSAQVTSHPHHIHIRITSHHITSHHMPSRAITCPALPCRPSSPINTPMANMTYMQTVGCEREERGDAEESMGMEQQKQVTTTRQDKTRQDKTRQDKTRQNKTRQRHIKKQHRWSTAHMDVMGGDAHSMSCTYLSSTYSVQHVHRPRTYRVRRLKQHRSQLTTRTDTHEAHEQTRPS